MHLLQSNVDLNMIRSWLGHASIETTNGYVEIDLEMKRKTLKSAEKLITAKGKQPRSWQKSPNILSWSTQILRGWQGGEVKWFNSNDWTSAIRLFTFA